VKLVAGVGGVGGEVLELPLLGRLGKRFVVARVASCGRGEEGTGEEKKRGAKC